MKLKYSGRVRAFRNSRPIVATLLAMTVVGCNWTSLISQSSSGVQANDFSSDPSLSFDGRYTVFTSFATNLVPNDNNNASDVFRRDNTDGTVIRVSVSSAGVEGNAGSSSTVFSVSADGNLIVFRSFADNLVAGDNNNFGDIFVRDVNAGTTERVSLNTAGDEANSFSSAPSISPNGNRVAFSSNATNLSPDDLNTVNDIFLRDLSTDTTLLVTIPFSGSGLSVGGLAGLSSDGRYVAFIGPAVGLAPGGSGGFSHVYVRDMQAPFSEKINLDINGNQANQSSNGPVAISPDGSEVTYASGASLQVAGDTNGTHDVFIADVATKLSERVSIDSNGVEANGFSTSPAMSADGRYVAFQSDATSLVTDNNGVRDVFVHDRVTGTTTRVSEDKDGVEANGQSAFDQSMSGDGRYVAFRTDASNLVSNDNNGVADIIIRAHPELSISSVIPDNWPIGATTSVTFTGSNFLPGTTVGIQGLGVGNNVQVLNENTITFDVTVPVGEPSGARDVSVILLGTGPGQGNGVTHVCEDCATLF